MNEAELNLAGLPVLVAGGTGLLGSHVVENLIRRGARVRATWHERPPGVDQPGIEYVRYDLGHLNECLAACQGMQAAFLCSGIVGGSSSILGGTVAATRTLVMNTQLMEAAALQGVGHVGLVSSTTIYPLSDHPLEEIEGFAGEPFKDYFGLAWCNRSLEMTATFLHRRQAFKVAIIRPSAIYGPRDRFDNPQAHVLPSLITRVELGENPLVIWGDGSAVRDFVYVEDVAEALVNAVLFAADAEPINIGSGKPITIKETAKAVLTAAGKESVTLSFDPLKPTTIPYRSISIARARNKISYEPRHDLATGLGETIAWYRTNKAAMRAVV